MKTLFQKIIDREIPAAFEHEDDSCVAIQDIDPQAPVHVLVIPREPIPRLGEALAHHETVLGHCLLVAAQLARKLDLADGFRIVINNGRDGGEAVPHLHIHLLGGRKMQWPPG